MLQSSTSYIFAMLAISYIGYAFEQVVFNPFMANVPHHIETIQLIYHPVNINNHKEMSTGKRKISKTLRRIQRALSRSS